MSYHPLKFGFAFGHNDVEFDGLFIAIRKVVRWAIYVLLTETRA